MIDAAAAFAPRVRLAHLPTPMQPMDRLADAIGRRPGTLFVKRDDETGLGTGGNHLRKLEFILADALESGSDWLVTAGDAESNAACTIAASAARCGLGCTLLLHGAREGLLSGNAGLGALLGADLVFADRGDPHRDSDLLEVQLTRLRAEGHTPYRVSAGASTPLGALGYVDAAREIAEQVPEVDVVVVATGSGGTHAGLVAGFGDHAMVHGVRVGTRRRLRERVETIAAQAATLSGRPRPAGRCILDENHLGAGYASPTEDGLAAVLLAARTEGLLLDPVCTGKAMASLIAASRSGALPADATVVFVHTGGLPCLLSERYAQWLEAGSERFTPPASGGTGAG